MRTQRRNEAQPITSPANPKSQSLDGGEFRTVAEFLKAVRAGAGLGSGQSCAVYLPDASFWKVRIEGVDRGGPFKMATDENKFAPTRVPGRWVTFTAGATAQRGQTDRLTLVSWREPL